MTSRTITLGIALACGAAARVEATPGVRCDVTGTWTGTADDDSGGHWTFTLELAVRDGTLAGTFHWKSHDDAGDEHVAGSVDCTKHTLALDGTSATGDLALGRYALALGGDGKTFRGKWTCITPCILGTISGAKR